MVYGVESEIEVGCPHLQHRCEFIGGQIGPVVRSLEQQVAIVVSVDDQTRPLVMAQAASGGPGDLHLGPVRVVGGLV